MTVTTSEDMNIDPILGNEDPYNVNLTSIFLSVSVTEITEQEAIQQSINQNHILLAGLQL